MKTIKEITGARGRSSCDHCSRVQDIEHLFYEEPSEEHSIGRKLCESCWDVVAELKSMYGVTSITQYREKYDEDQSSKV